MLAMSSRPPDASPSADAAAANEAGHRQQAKEVLRLSSTMQPVLLSDPLDEDNLTDTLCFVRRQTQFFAAHSDDVEARFSKGGKKAEIRVGQIGIRCAHCARCARVCSEPGTGDAHWRAHGTNNLRRHTGPEIAHYEARTAH